MPLSEHHAIIDDKSVLSKNSKCWILGLNQGGTYY